MFLNETMHPLTSELFNVIEKCGNLREHGDYDYYAPLVEWWKGQNLTEEKAADLYSRVAEAFEGRPLHSVPRGFAASLLSKCLHATDRIYH